MSTGRPGTNPCEDIEGQCGWIFRSCKTPNYDSVDLDHRQRHPIAKAFFHPSVLAGGIAPAQVHILAKSHKKQPIQIKILHVLPFPLATPSVCTFSLAASAGNSWNKCFATASQGSLTSQLTISIS